MIRREIQLADGVPRWLLISQVEHARLSGQLAERCIGTFARNSRQGMSREMDIVRQELLAAIVHHDDGWLEWEADPRMDSQRQRPLSFVELPLEDSLAVWTGSIAAAATQGNLAAWTVAGHFSTLLSSSSHYENDGRGTEWLEEIGEQRRRWFQQWHDAEPQVRTVQLAAEALAWLQMFDVLSLWPCTACPVEGEQVSQWPEPYAIGQSGIPVEEISVASRERDRRSVPSGDPCQVLLRPWPFADDRVPLEAAAHTVPARRYESAAELLSARSALVARWQLVPGG